MELKLELSDAICKRIETAAAHNLISVEAFVRHAIETELLRLQDGCALPLDNSDLAGLARQVHKLEQGQRAIIALVNSSASVLAALLRERGAPGDKPSHSVC